MAYASVRFCYVCHRVDDLTASVLISPVDLLAWLITLIFECTCFYVEVISRLPCEKSVQDTTYYSNLSLVFDAMWFTGHSVLLHVRRCGYDRLP